jgi:hypothetical protein
MLDNVEIVVEYSLRAAYKTAAQYCAYIHLGSIPHASRAGICGNLAQLLDDAGFEPTHVESVSVELRRFFRGLGLNEHYPVENSPIGYAASRDKYRGKFGATRRALAGLMAYRLNKRSKDFI